MNITLSGIENLMNTDSSKIKKWTPKVKNGRANLKIWMDKSNKTQNGQLEQTKFTQLTFFTWRKFVTIQHSVICTIKRERERGGQGIKKDYCLKYTSNILINDK